MKSRVLARTIDELSKTSQLTTHHSTIECHQSSTHGFIEPKKATAETVLANSERNTEQNIIVY